MSSRAPLIDRLNAYTVINGVPGPTPFSSNVPCRLVEQDQIFPIFDGFAMRSYWLTMDLEELSCGATFALGNLWGISWTQSNLVVVTTRDDLELRPIMRELIVIPDSITYYRYSCVLHSEMAAYGDNELTISE